MLDLDGFDSSEDEYEKSHRRDYLKFIEHCKNLCIDTQPHISPLSMYIANKYPDWKDFSVEVLLKMFRDNYRHVISKSMSYINIIGEDVFDLASMNATLPFLLLAYNKKWEKSTGLQVEGYAAHGASPINMNRVLHNGIILDQALLLKSDIYKYDVYNSRVKSKLKYLSDNSLPLWMIEPNRIPDGRYQLLKHPSVWSDTSVERFSNISSIAYTSGYALYPYLANQEIVTNLTHFLDSGLEINDYFNINNPLF